MIILFNESPDNALMVCIHLCTGLLKHAPIGKVRLFPNLLASSIPSSVSPIISGFLTPFKVGRYECRINNLAFEVLGMTLNPSYIVG